VHTRIIVCDLEAAIDLSLILNAWEMIEPRGSLNSLAIHNLASWLSLWASIAAYLPLPASVVIFSLRHSRLTTVNMLRCQILLPVVLLLEEIYVYMRACVCECGAT
jgi:hypothetical protein